MMQVRFRSISVFLASAVLLPMLLGSVGCNSYDDQQKQIAGYQGQAQADSQTAENNREAQAMEQDLAVRQHFFQGVTGTFDGTIPKDQGFPNEVDVRMLVSATVPAYHGDRIRQREEIVSDLDNLHLDVQVLQSDPETGAVFPCIFTGIQPDLKTGLIRLVDPGCPNAYSIWLVQPPTTDTGKTGNPAQSGQPDLVQEGPQAWQAQSTSVTQDLLSQQVEQAMAFAVEMDPGHVLSTPRFLLKRAE